MSFPPRVSTLAATFPLRLICLLLICFLSGNVAHAQRGGLRERLQKAKQQRERQALQQKQVVRLPALDVPTEARSFTLQRAALLRGSAAQIERIFAELATFRQLARGETIIDRASQLLRYQAEIDDKLTAVLAARGTLVELPKGDARRNNCRAFLQISASLIDLSARLRFILYDALSFASFEVAANTPLRQQLLEQLIAYRNSNGAVLFSEFLFDPPKDNQDGEKPLSIAEKKRILHLCAVTRETQVLPVLAEYMLAEQTHPEMVLATAATIREIGLPQSPRPGRDRTLPTPSLTAGDVVTTLEKIPAAKLTPPLAAKRKQLLDWYRSHQRGIPENSYRWGDMVIQPGDWLLMKNPSPYNLFTDLSPGLFTHVGIVALETGSDGVRRMVLNDLPERGQKLNTTTFDTFVKRTLHYVVLRHPDTATAEKMGQVAATIIGNPTQFDLNFRTSRVEALKGKPLKGRKIHTYCAGLLLLCGQETAAPRSDFFPIAEFPAGGNTVRNLAGIGLSFGDNFISPTGALFSAKMQIVGRRDSLYDSSRETEEEIYNHFARQLVHRKLTPSPDAFQSLRTKIAEASKTNPLLAKALASAAGVSDEMDLVAAAKTAAVVEALDEVAQSCSLGFRGAWSAMRAGPEKELSQLGFEQAEIEAILAYRERHASLYRDWLANKVSPRELRGQLVQYYITRGRKQLDERFFNQSSD